MATYSLYEYGTLTPWGEPVEPPFLVTAGLSSGSAKALNAGTVYFKVIPDADVYLRVGSSTVTATTTDRKLVANFGGGAVVPAGGGCYIYVAV